MLNNDEQLRDKINGFLRRKEAKYPELSQPLQLENMPSGSLRSDGFHFAGATGQ